MKSVLRNIIFLLLLLPPSVQAQRRDIAMPDSFGVASFRVLPNDVSAFVRPVRDLNGDACALLKVVGPREMAFSTPLGIVKRQNKVGEIWLFVPQGTRRLTLKHPQWGVVRDHALGCELESRMSYELRLRLPVKETVRRDTVVVKDTVLQTLHDTVRIVPKPRVRLPFRTYIAASVGMGREGVMPGVMVAVGRRHGGYAHATFSARRAPQSHLVCDDAGYVVEIGRTPYYTGTVRRAAYTLTAGLMHRIGSRWAVFEGAGYGCHTTRWQLAPSEGGGWARNSEQECKGVALQVGAMYLWRRMTFTAYATTTRFRRVQLGVGVGINLGKR